MIKCCYECERRKLGCHIKCEQYNREKLESDTLRNTIQQDNYIKMLVSKGYRWFGRSSK